MQSIQTALAPVTRSDLRQPTQNHAPTSDTTKRPERLPTSASAAKAIDSAQRGQLFKVSPNNSISTVASTLVTLSRLMKPLILLLVITGKFSTVSAQSINQQIGELQISVSWLDNRTTALESSVSTAQIAITALQGKNTTTTTSQDFTDLKHNFTTYKSESEQQLATLTTDTNARFTDTDAKFAAMAAQIAKLSQPNTNDGVTIGNTHIDYTTLAIGGFTVISLGIIALLTHALMAAKKAHKDLANITTVIAALTSETTPLQHLREDVRAKATSLSNLIRDRRFIQHSINITFNAQPAEAPPILRIILDAELAIAEYLALPIEYRTQKDTSKFAQNITLLTANNLPHSPLDLAITSVHQDISDTRRVINDAQRNAATGIPIDQREAATELVTI